MAFEKDNQWWRKRAKHGRNALFTEPEKLWEACVEYFDYTDSRNDWDGQNWVGKDGDEVIVKKRVPYTLSGLCVFLDVSPIYLNEFEKSETYKRNPDFSIVLTRVRKIVETQQVEGALNGYYNANLTARLNGFTDKQDLTSGGEAIKPTIIVQSQQAADNLKKLSE